MISSDARHSIFSNVMMSACLLVLGVGTAYCLRPCLFPTLRERLVADVLQAYVNREPSTLERARKLVEAFPGDLFAFALYADAAAMNYEHELAVKLYKELETAGGKWAVRAQVGLARRYEVQGRLTLAERSLRQALAVAPQHMEANIRLGYLLQLEGRTWEAAPHYFTQTRRGRCRGDELLGMASSERFFLQDLRLERTCPLMNPPELMINLPLARQAIYENRVKDAEAMLRELLAARPDLGEAQGRLGRIIVDRGDATEFLQWLAQLPPDARDHPEVWFVQGLYARRIGQMEGAIYCLAKALSVSPNHISANIQMAGCLERVGQNEAAKAFGRRGELLSEYESVLNLIRANTDAKLIARTAPLMGKLGRYWEAAGWCSVMLQMGINLETSRQDMRRWVTLARSDTVPNASQALPMRLIRVEDYRPPRWPLPAVGAVRLPGHSDGSVPQETVWKLVDDAERLGIKFRYYEGTTEETRMQHIFNTMGGGLGSIDYDNDGWPDLYLAQANNWRGPQPQTDYSDRLFRNQLGGAFSDVTTDARINEIDFSHGVNVGDYNQDGFADIYVGNKGPNRLYRNNGDGTFDDVTAESGTGGNEWSTSSVFADLTGDGLPELFVLNYSRLKETAEKECTKDDGTNVACTPDLLIAEADRCYLNLGDGAFRDISKETGIDLPSGKGLGIVVWDFQGDNRPGLFVANDTSPNFLFLQSGSDSQGIPKFGEEALLRGVAVDLDGNAQASMGVAAGDVNHDGRIDLFITTFFGESKTLFSQREDGFFDDMSRPYDLRNAGFWMLGFGCQFLDLNGDGWEDLIATNGHVDQRSARGDADRMPPQIFLNQAGRRFAEVPRARLGGFFQGNYLGRGLAKFDWNRDGRTDVGISHLHGPFALLTNLTPPAGRPLAVKLVGRNGTREAIGATVRVNLKASETNAATGAASLQQRQQPVNKAQASLIRLHTGGDGFLVTNERLLHFSIPTGQTDVEVEVKWPHGEVERWSNVKSGQEILVIEGARSPLVMRKLEPL